MKIKWIGGVFALLAILSIFYFSGVMQNTNVADFIAQSSRTGLAGSPLAQVALNDSGKNQKELASIGVEEGIKSSGAGASSQQPRALFDISARPIFSGLSWTEVFLQVSSVALIVLFLSYLTYKFFRKRKLKKIKTINRV